MNGAQLHLALNHFPVVISLLSLVLLLWYWAGKSPDLKNAGLAFVILGGAFTGIAYFTGEPAEGVIEKLPGFSESLVHEHEEAAEFALIISGISALHAFAVFMLSRRKPKLAFGALIVVTTLTLLNCAVFLRTAHLGGLIKHEEIRTP